MFYHSDPTAEFKLFFSIFLGPFDMKIFVKILKIIPGRYYNF